MSIKNYKKAKYDAIKLVALKKQAFFDEKLLASVGKPKEVWNTLKYHSMPKKTIVSNFNAFDNNKSWIYDVKRMSSFLKSSNLAESLKLLDPTDKFNPESVLLLLLEFCNPWYVSH